MPDVSLHNRSVPDFSTSIVGRASQNPQTIHRLKSSTGVTHCSMVQTYKCGAFTVRVSSLLDSDLLLLSDRTLFKLVGPASAYWYFFNWFIWYPKWKNLIQCYTLYWIKHIKWCYFPTIPCFQNWQSDIPSLWTACTRCNRLGTVNIRWPALRFSDQLLSLRLPWKYACPTW